MNKYILKNGVGWGFLLWLVGYILGIVFFMFVPPDLLGWAIMPIGILLTLWVLFKKIKYVSLPQFLMIGIIWTFIAIVFDYVFLVLVFKPADGYYKLDVYVYYLLTFLLPLIVGWRKTALGKFKP